MKTNLLRFSIAAALAAAAAYAQSSAALQANVPFDFVVSSRVLPAGQYTLVQGPGTLIIRSVDRTGAAIVLTEGLRSNVAAKDGKLVFHRYGDMHFLSEVWAPGQDGRRLPAANWERELAAGLSTPATTTTAAVR